MPTDRKKCNVLLIMTDNQPADLLGCYGNNEIHTPHIDRLARQGIQFHNVFCPNGMCSPSRASVLTGLMPSQHGIHTWIDDRQMDQWPENWNAVEEFSTLPEILQEQGYKTALIGKYHLGMPFQAQNGIEHWVTFPYGHTRSFWDNLIIENGRQFTYPGHSVDCFTEQAVAYLKAHDPQTDPPFFLFLTYNAPYGHKPAIAGIPRNRYARLYADCEMRSIPRVGISLEAIRRYEFKKDQTGGGIDYSDELTTPNDLTALRNYFSQVSMVDDGVGRVLAALEERGLAGDTLVIYTSDHGFSLGHHGYWGHGQATWPSNTHRAAFSVPMLLRHSSQIEAGQSSRLLVNSLDLFATILDYLGVWEVTAHDGVPSRSFAPLLLGKQLSWENAIYMEQEETRAIRTDQWLYMKRFSGSRQFPLADALYNLADDADEKENVIANAGVADTAAALSRRIDRFFNQYADPRYDLWQGGSAKSNVDKPWLWRDAWGKEWQVIRP